jgi:hypothetical protein
MRRHLNLLILPLLALACSTGNSMNSSATTPPANTMSPSTSEPSQQASAQATFAAG